MNLLGACNYLLGDFLAKFASVEIAQIIQTLSFYFKCNLRYDRIYVYFPFM